MRYHLPQDVFFCRAGSHCVFLDVERDLYVTVNRTSIDALAPWLSNRADKADSPTWQDIPSAAASVAHDLVTQGLLSVDELTSKAFETVTLPVPRTIEVPQQPLMCNATRFPRFYAACHAADHRLAKARVRNTIDFVRRRKTQRLAGSSTRRNRLLSLVSTFKALRLFYPRPYLCLFDSLALIEFLAMYGFFPTWVFGVQGEPFKAHCWVQYEDLLLNESLHRVARLTPIMTV